MIESNASSLHNQLKKIHAETVRKLENMVSGFIHETIVENAVDLTPYGDINDKTARHYERRFNQYGWSKKPGLAKGGWKVRLETGYDASLSGSPVVYLTDNSGAVYDDVHGSEAKSYAVAMTESYKLGQNIIVINTTPYVAGSGINVPKALGKAGSLEGGYSNQAPNGIMNPLMDVITRSYQADLQRYYDAG